MTIDPMFTSRVGAAIQAGLRFLQAEQQPDGSWLSWFASSTSFFHAAPARECFTTALIVRAAAASKERSLRALPCIQKACDFLSRAHNEDGLWRFFGHGSPQLPADFDTTACAATALELCAIPVDRTPIRESLLAHSHPLGGYWTWDMPAEAAPEGWPYQIRHNQRDWTVNACILWWLNLTGEPAAPLLEELAHVLRAGKYFKPTPYYDSPYLFLYSLYHAISAAPERPANLAAEIERAVLDLFQRPGRTFLDYALGLACLPMRETDQIAPVVEELLSSQSGDGGWPLHSIFGFRQQMVYGCRAASTALAVTGLCNCIERSIP